jgi:hypothetical protein
VYTVAVVQFLLAGGLGLLWWLNAANFLLAKLLCSLVPWTTGYACILDVLVPWLGLRCCLLCLMASWLVMLVGRLGLLSSWRAGHAF